MSDNQSIEDYLRAQLNKTSHIWATIQRADETISYCSRCGKRLDQVTIEATLDGITQLPCKGFVG